MSEHDERARAWISDYTGDPSPGDDATYALSALLAEVAREAFASGQRAEKERCAGLLDEWLADRLTLADLRETMGSGGMVAVPAPPPQAELRTSDVPRIATPEEAAEGMKAYLACVERNAPTAPPPSRVRGFAEDGGCVSVNRAERRCSRVRGHEGLHCYTIRLVSAAPPESTATGPRPLCETIDWSVKCGVCFVHGGAHDMDTHRRLVVASAAGPTVDKPAIPSPPPQAEPVTWRVPVPTDELPTVPPGLPGLRRGRRRPLVGRDKEVRAWVGGIKTLLGRSVGVSDST